MCVCVCVKNRTALVFMLEKKNRQFKNPWKIPYKRTFRSFNFIFPFLFEILDG